MITVLVIPSAARNLVSVPAAARFSALRAQNDKDLVPVILSAAKDLASMCTDARLFVLRAQNDNLEVAA